jgi:multicomponent K+:H+ antiporter subunit G
MDYLLSLLIITGAVFTFIGSLGLLRLKDFYTRLHGPTKATTLGVGCILLASALYFSLYSDEISLHEILVTLFLFVTAPVSAHLLAKAALYLQLKPEPGTRADPLADHDESIVDKTSEASNR